MITCENVPVSDGDYAILQRGSVNQLIRIMEKKPVYFCKQKIFLSQAIGKSYGSLFELKGKDLQPVTAALPDLPIQAESSAKDNRSLNDDGTSQQLTRDEIETLKLEGASSGTIVQNLIENSLTFHNKTQYSQEKYVKKKKDKYVSYIRILRTNIRLLAELYHKHGPPKICNLRVDTLSQMLTAANVMSGGHYLVVDACLGLLVSAVLQKTLPDGKVIQLYTEAGPVSSYRHAVDAMNFSKEEINNALFGISYQNLFPGKEKEAETIKFSTNDENDALRENCDEQLDVQTAHDDDEAMDLDNSEQNKEGRNSFLEKKKAKKDRKALRKKEAEEALGLLTQNSLDGLLVCSRIPPGPLALDLLQYLAPSRPFALHSMTFQPLVEAYDLIKNSNRAIFLKLSETWLRKYQVLPDRTHPEINMSNTGGYLLTGIKVEPVCR